MSSTIIRKRIPLPKAELGEGDAPIPYEYLPRDHFKVFPRGSIVGDPAPTPKPTEVKPETKTRVRMRDWKQQ